VWLEAKLGRLGALCPKVSALGYGFATDLGIFPLSERSFGDGEIPDLRGNFNIFSFLFLLRSSVGIVYQICSDAFVLSSALTRG
jgi:hypothetical protein